MTDEKILNEELMTDEELDKVAGGSYIQVADDARLLYEYGFIDDYCVPEESFDVVGYSRYNDKVDAGWSKVGIMCVSKYAKGNLYFMKDTGKEISVNEARDYLMKNYKQVRSLYLDFKGY